MHFVTVDNHQQRLTVLQELLKSHFPYCYVTEFTDPMLSAKFIISNHVDMVFVQENMHRIDGTRLMQVINLNKPSVQVRLFSEVIDTVDCVLSLKE